MDVEHDQAVDQLADDQLSDLDLDHVAGGLAKAPRGPVAVASTPAPVATRRGTMSSFGALPSRSWSSSAPIGAAGRPAAGPSASKVTGAGEACPGGVCPVP